VSPKRGRCELNHCQIVRSRKEGCANLGVVLVRESGCRWTRALTSSPRLEAQAQQDLIAHLNALEVEMNATGQGGTMQIGAMEMGLFAITVQNTRVGTRIDDTHLLAEWRRLRSAFVPQPWFVALEGDPIPGTAAAREPQVAAGAASMLSVVERLQKLLEDERPALEKLIGVELMTLAPKSTTATPDDWNRFDLRWQQALDRATQGLPAPVLDEASTKKGIARAGIGEAILMLRDLPSLHVVKPQPRQWAEVINHATMLLIDARYSLDPN
jgi:hypothetical protein